MIAVSRSLMPAPPGASFLRHGCQPPSLLHLLLICQNIIGIAQFWSQLSSGNLSKQFWSLRIRKLSNPSITPQSLAMASLFLQRVGEVCELLVICLITFSLKWGSFQLRSLVTHRGVKQWELPVPSTRFIIHILRRKKFSSVIMPVCFLPRREPLL